VVILEQGQADKQQQGRETYYQVGTFHNRALGIQSCKLDSKTTNEDGEHAQHIVLPLLPGVSNYSQLSR